MKTFLSQSGERSQEVATVLKDWLRCVIQSSKPWISTEDLDRGSLWFGAINDQLKDTSIGIICLTQENKNRPWILFEAGALAKGLPSNRVCTFLIDLTPTDVKDPLAQFNHTLPNKKGLLALVRTLNKTMGDAALDDEILIKSFETYWPQFEEKFSSVLGSTESQTPAVPRPDNDVSAEILENTRALGSRLRKLEVERNPTHDDIKSKLLFIAELHDIAQTMVTKDGKVWDTNRNSYSVEEIVKQIVTEIEKNRVEKNY